MNNQMDDRMRTQWYDVRRTILQSAADAPQWGLSVEEMALSWIKHEDIFESGTVWADADGMSFGFTLDRIQGGLVFRADTYECHHCWAVADIWPPDVVWRPKRVRVRGGDKDCDHEFVVTVTDDDEAITFRADDQVVPPVLGEWSSHS